LDPFALLTIAATATERATLGLNALNLPQYARPWWPDPSRRSTSSAEAVSFPDSASDGRLTSIR